MAVSQWAQNSTPRSSAPYLFLTYEPFPARTIRTYHPEYLQRSRQLGLIAEISSWALSEAAGGHQWVPPLGPAPVPG
jgi:hypothetical protein